MVEPSIRNSQQRIIEKDISASINISGTSLRSSLANAHSRSNRLLLLHFPPINSLLPGYITQSWGAKFPNWIDNPNVACRKNSPKSESFIDNKPQDVYDLKIKGDRHSCDCLETAANRRMHTFYTRSSSRCHGKAVR